MYCLLVKVNHNFLLCCALDITGQPAYILGCREDYFRKPSLLRGFLFKLEAKNASFKCIFWAGSYCQMYLVHFLFLCNKTNIFNVNLYNLKCIYARGYYMYNSVLLSSTGADEHFVFAYKHKWELSIWKTPPSAAAKHSPGRWWVIPNDFFL